MLINNLYALPKAEALILACKIIKEISNLKVIDEVSLYHCNSFRYFCKPPYNSITEFYLIINNKQMRVTYDQDTHRLIDIVLSTLLDWAMLVYQHNLPMSIRVPTSKGYSPIFCIPTGSLSVINILNCFTLQLYILKLLPTLYNTGTLEKINFNNYDASGRTIHLLVSRSPVKDFPFKVTSCKNNYTVNFKI